jgi:undecaprenyl-diphosphatase
MRRFIVVLGFALAGCLRLVAATPETAAPKGLTARDAIILGLVEGVTEFLPISSTGHLIIASRALGLDAETPLRDAEGELLWHERPSEENPAGVPLTRKLAVDTYIVVIQVGAIVAVVLLYWRQLMGILRGLAGRDAVGIRLLRNLLLAFLPVVFAGLLLGDWIDAHLFSIGAVVAALVSGAVLMFAAERWRKQNSGAGTSRKEPHELSVRQSIAIGCMQCLALWPGMSRSMVTMVGGYFAGLSPAKSAEFSFLVGLPVLGGAAGYKLVKAGPGLFAVFGWGEMLLGAAVAAVSAAIAIKFFVGYLARNGLGVFAGYRLVLAVVLTAVFLI